eukprot:248984_1
MRRVSRWIPLFKTTILMMLLLNQKRFLLPMQIFLSERLDKSKIKIVAANTETVPPVSTTTTETVITAAVNTIPTSKKLQKAQGAPVDMGGRAQYTRKAGGSTPSRPISMMHRSKSKSTGMISPPEQSVQLNSPGLYTASSSGSMMPPKQQHQQHQQQYNNQSFNKFNIKRPSNIKAS